MTMTSKREAACPAMKVIFGVCGKNEKGEPLFPYHNIVDGVCTACYSSTNQVVESETMRTT